jgi:hypothetical protein
LLGREEIAVVDTAVALHQFDPSGSEALEVRELRGVDHVVHDASDHR